MAQTYAQTILLAEEIIVLERSKRLVESPLVILDHHVVFTYR